MQADFTLYLRNLFDCQKDGKFLDWWPNTLLYATHHGFFKIYAKAESTEYFQKITRMLNISSKKDFDALIQKIAGGKLRTPRWGFHSVSVQTLCNYQNLASKA